ncbi:MAG TPA: hypothetical protein PLO93_07240, partial [Candidatus Omnitrophota bacterium]|nr:hypothetical protein [Candidatus Omnitrophota bacterium]
SGAKQVVEIISKIWGGKGEVAVLTQRQLFRQETEAKAKAAEMSIAQFDSTAAVRDSLRIDSLQLVSKKDLVDAQINALAGNPDSVLNDLRQVYRYTGASKNFAWPLTLSAGYNYNTGSLISVPFTKNGLGTVNLSINNAFGNSINFLQQTTGLMNTTLTGTALEIGVGYVAYLHAAMELRNSIISAAHQGDGALVTGRRINGAPVLRPVFSKTHYMYENKIITDTNDVNSFAERKDRSHVSFRPGQFLFNDVMRKYVPEVITGITDEVFALPFDMSKDFNLTDSAKTMKAKTGVQTFFSGLVNKTLGYDPAIVPAYAKPKYDVWAVIGDKEHAFVYDSALTCMNPNLYYVIARDSIYAVGYVIDLQDPMHPVVKEYFRTPRFIDSLDRTFFIDYNLWLEPKQAYIVPTGWMIQNLIDAYSVRSSKQAIVAAQDPRSGKILNTYHLSQSPSIEHRPVYMKKGTIAYQDSIVMAPVFTDTILGSWPNGQPIYPN